MATEKRDERPSFSRREFVKGIGIGAGAVVLFGRFGVNAAAWALSGDPVLKMVLVDYTKCTGCRTCETACSSRNRPVTINGEDLPGLGNPRYANIRVQSFNPEVDVPNVCAMCADTPCVKACPVKPDAKTGRRALYRDEATRTISNDTGRCIGCRELRQGLRLTKDRGDHPQPRDGQAGAHMHALRGQSAVRQALPLRGPLVCRGPARQEILRPWA